MGFYLGCTHAVQKFEGYQVSADVGDFSLAYVTVAFNHVGDVANFICCHCVSPLADSIAHYGASFNCKIQTNIRNPKKNFHFSNRPELWAAI